MVLALTALLALSAIAALEWWFRERAEAAPGTVRAAPSAAGTAGPAPAPRLPALYVEVDRVLLLGRDGAVVPAAAAPVLEVCEGGRILVRVPPPLPSGPGRPRSELAAVILPADSLAALSPEQRALLLEVLGLLWPDRPVDPSRLSFAGVSSESSEIGRLLSWLR